MISLSLSLSLSCVCLQHNRFVQECKDAEPDVLFVGDSMIQLMQQYEVGVKLFNLKNSLKNTFLL